MQAFQIVPVLLFAASAHHAPKPGAKFCADLLPGVQRLVKVPLVVKSSDDATTDATHTGEAGYAACVFATGQGTQVSIIMSDDPDKNFTDLNAKGYAPLAGFGDRARVARKGYAHVDVMKGSTFCEVIYVLEPDQTTEADWAQGAGKMCVAAFAAR